MPTLPPCPFVSLKTKNLNIESLIRPNILALSPYATARDEYSGPIGIFLDANESPYPNGFNRYPDPHQKALKERLSAIKGVPEANIFLGNGSDEAIDLIFRVFCIPGVDNVVAISPSYGMYSVAAATNDVEFRSCLLREDFSLDSDRLLSLCDAHTKAIFLCSPNNPSGNAFEKEQLLSIARRFNGILVVDEAYVDFSAKGSLVGSLKGHPNIVVLQTLSKAYGMAGLRIGLAIADEYIVRLFSMVKYPYNINVLAQKAALEALEKPICDHIRALVSERERVARELLTYANVKKVYPSDANFLLVEFDDAASMYEHLLSDGIIVRCRNSMPLCKGCLRLTIGLPSENDKLLASIKRHCQ